MLNIKVDTELDVKGLSCPMPMLKAKKTLAAMSAGQVLSVWATDKNVLEDFRAFCAHTGHELLDHDIPEEGVYHLLLKRKAD